MIFLRAIRVVVNVFVVNVVEKVVANVVENVVVKKII